MKWVFAGLFLLFYTSVLSQKVKLTHIDSLEIKLKSLKPGRAKELVEEQLFIYYLNTDAKKALNLAKIALAEAQQLKNDSVTCTFYDFTGEAYIYLENSGKALEYLNKDYNLAQKIGYRQQVALAFCDMAGVYMNQSDYATAQSYNFKSLAIYEQLKDYRQIGVCNLNIGVTYNNNNDYKKAIFYGQRVVQLTKRIKNKDMLPLAYNLIGTSYASLNKIADARNFYQKALELYRQEKNDYGTATVLSLLFSTYPGDYQKQVELGLKAQALWNKVAPENFYSINNLGNLGSIYGRMAMREKIAAKREELFKQSEAYLLNAINLAKKTNTKSVLIDFNDSLSVINAAMGNYKDAYYNLKTSSVLYDSVYSQDNKNKIASLEGKHEIELRDKQIQINKLEIADKRKQAGFLAGGIAFLIVIALLLYRQNRIKQKANKQLDESNRIKTRFFGILNHDLRSPVTSFIHLLYMKQNEAGMLTDAAALAYENKIKLSAENLLATMEDLLLWSKGQMENFKPQLEDIPVNALYDYIRQQFDQDKIAINCQSPEGMFIHTDEHYLKTIMQNLTNNAVKALAGTENATITWQAWENKSGKYLSISDNGPGATEDQLKPLYDDSAPIGIRKGLGLHIVRDLAKAINCQVTVNAKPGKGVQIRLGFE
jgi:signal transduction histidine kinase